MSSSVVAAILARSTFGRVALISSNVIGPRAIGPVPSCSPSGLK